MSCVVQLTCRKQVSVKSPTQGHFTLWSHQFQPGNCVNQTGYGDCSAVSSWTGMINKWRRSLAVVNLGKRERGGGASGAMKSTGRKWPHSENAKCLQDEDPLVHLSAPPSTPCHSHRHTAIAPNQPITAGFCLRGLIGWLAKLISTPPSVTTSTYTVCKLSTVSCRVCVRTYA